MSRSNTVSLKLYWGMVTRACDGDQLAQYLDLSSHTTLCCPPRGTESLSAAASGVRLSRVIEQEPILGSLVACISKLLLPLLLMTRIMDKNA